jgi:hypothetical protein
VVVSAEERLCRRMIAMVESQPDIPERGTAAARLKAQL